MAYVKRLELRPNLEPDHWLYRLIRKDVCWHFDAWIYRAAAAYGDACTYYLKVEERTGGRTLNIVRRYRIDGDELGPSLVQLKSIPEHAQAVTLSDPRCRGAYELLNAVHWRHVLPMTRARPSAFKSRSICLHYVRAADLDPCEGATNVWKYNRKII